MNNQSETINVQLIGNLAVNTSRQVNSTGFALGPTGTIGFRDYRVEAMSTLISSTSVRTRNLDVETINGQPPSYGQTGATGSTGMMGATGAVGATGPMGMMATFIGVGTALESPVTVNDSNCTVSSSIFLTFTNNPWVITPYTPFNYFITPGNGSFTITFYTSVNQSFAFDSNLDFRYLIINS